MFSIEDFGQWNEAKNQQRIYRPKRDEPLADLWSQELKGHGYFEHIYLRIIDSTFSLPEFVPTCKKSAYFICSFLKYNFSLESHDQAGHTHFSPCSPKKLLISV